MADNVKTNVMRLLEKEGVAHRVHYYDPARGIDGVSVAAQLRQDPQAVFKTLVTQGKSRAFYVFVIPVAATLNLKRAATACGEKAIEMIPQKILLPTTGYIHGGCSPIGMKKAFPTYIDETAQLFDAICVSAGKIGAQAELAPDDLCRVTGAVYAPLTD
ncbi:MAG: Cys-tRNA(Pro) deacylase [Clostridia bacterium]|nr:Cys-tRNA(Pro) deacylase [Clostridia bacterium]